MTNFSGLVTDADASAVRAKESDGGTANRSKESADGIGIEKILEQDEGSGTKKKDIAMSDNEEEVTDEDLL